MNEFQIALLIGAIFVSLISLHIPRAHIWILAGGASFVASTAYARFGLPYPPAFTLACDAAVCLSIYFLCSERWEEWLFRVFQLSVLVSLIYLAGPLTVGGFTITMSHYLYVVMLELCNWIALFLIGGTAVGEWVRRHEDSARIYRTGHLHRARGSWRSARISVPFHKAGK